MTREIPLSMVDRWNTNPFCNCHPHVYFTPWRKTYGVLSRPYFYLPGFEGKWMVKAEWGDKIVVIQDRKTGVIRPMWNGFDYYLSVKGEIVRKLEKTLKKYYKLLPNGVYLRKKKVGKPSKYSKLEKEILKKCSHHKFIYDILVNEVFGSDNSAKEIVLSRYNKLIKHYPQHSTRRWEIETLCEYIRKSMEIEENSTDDKPLETNEEKSKDEKRKYRKQQENVGDYSDVPGLFDTYEGDKDE